MDRCCVTLPKRGDSKFPVEAAWLPILDSCTRHGSPSTLSQAKLPAPLTSEADVAGETRITEHGGGSDSNWKVVHVLYRGQALEQS